MSSAPCPLYPALRTSIGNIPTRPLAFLRNTLYSPLSWCCISLRAPALPVSTAMTSSLFVGSHSCPPWLLKSMCVCVCVSPFFQGASLLSPAEHEVLLHDWQWNRAAVANTVCLTILPGNQSNTGANQSNIWEVACTFPLCEADDRGPCHAVFSPLWYHTETGSQPLWRSKLGNDKHSLDLVNLHNKWFSEPRTRPVPWEIGRLTNSDSSHKHNWAQIPKLGKKVT